MGRAEKRVEELFRYFDLDPPEDTVRRYAEVLNSINAQHENLDDIRNGIFNEPEVTGLQLEKSIPIFSYCEHHILPWFGIVHAAYIGEGKVLGLSKFTRVCRYYSVGLTLQERVAHDIARFFLDSVSTSVIIMIEALHTCKVSRGVQNPFSRSVTIEAHGIFRDNTGAKMEFFEAIKTGN